MTKEEINKMSAQEYDCWLHKQIEKSLSGRKISAKEANKILGFDPETYRKGKIHERY